MQKQVIIENFGQTHLKWNVINDSVMGGVSKSRVQILSDQKALFSGNVSLRNNGGFASAAAPFEGMDLKEIKKIRLRVKGDGKIYSFRLRISEAEGEISFAVYFRTKKYAWTEHEFFLREFIPTFRGKIIPNAPPVNPEKIVKVGFLISGKQEGNFGLVVDWIKGIK